MFCLSSQQNSRYNGYNQVEPMSSLRGQYLSRHDKTGPDGGTVDTVVRFTRDDHYGTAEYGALFYSLWTIENGL